LKILLVSLFIVIIDQVSKLLIKGFSIPLLELKFKGIAPGQKIPLISDIFSLTLIENPGIAFGIDLGSDFRLPVVIFTFIATSALLYYYYLNRTNALSLRLSLAFIIGGAIGNLIDRIFYGIFYGYAPVFYGKVVDFFEINILKLFIMNRTVGNYVLNIADLAVTAGLVLLLFSLNRQRAADNKAESLEEYLAEDKD
jgi:signal peptidase II